MLRHTRIRSNIHTYTCNISNVVGATGQNESDIWINLAYSQCGFSAIYAKTHAHVHTHTHHFAKLFQLIKGFTSVYQLGRAGRDNGEEGT